MTTKKPFLSPATYRCDIFERYVEVPFDGCVLAFPLRRVLMIPHSVKIVEAVITAESTASAASVLTEQVVRVHGLCKGIKSISMISRSYSHIAMKQ